MVCWVLLLGIAWASEALDRELAHGQAALDQESWREARARAPAAVKLDGTSVAAYQLYLDALGGAGIIEYGLGDLATVASEDAAVGMVIRWTSAQYGAGAFEPVIATVSEGTVLRVLDAVAIIYRTAVHNSLVAMTTEDWGQSTEYLSYNMPAWWEWYNTRYVPLKNDQARRAALTDRNSPSRPAAPKP